MENESHIMFEEIAKMDTETLQSLFDATRKKARTPEEEIAIKHLYRVFDSKKLRNAMANELNNRRPSNRAERRVRIAEARRAEKRSNN